MPGPTDRISVMGTSICHLSFTEIHAAAEDNMPVFKCPYCPTVFNGCAAKARIAKHMLQCTRSTASHDHDMQDFDHEQLKVRGRRVAYQSKPHCQQDVVQAVTSNEKLKDNASSLEPEVSDGEQHTTSEVSESTESIQERLDEEFVSMLHGMGDVQAQYVIDFINKRKTLGFTNVAQMKSVLKRVLNKRGAVPEWTALKVSLSHEQLPGILSQGDEPVEFIFNHAHGLQLLSSVWGDQRNSGYMVFTPCIARNAEGSR